MQSPLREWREGPDRLDLVAEELDSQRLPARGREDVDQPAADGELTALLDPLDAFVAGERETLGKQVDSRLLPLGDHDRLGPLARRRHPLCERGRGGADEPAASEHVERPRPLADEVRRRLEARCPVNSSARQQRHAVLAEEPGSSLGRVPCVGVLGQRANETPIEALVERREQQRQRRLGDASARRQRLGEGREPLVLEELVDECVQDRSVHRKRRNPRFRARIVAV